MKRRDLLKLACCAPLPVLAKPALEESNKITMIFRVALKIPHNLPCHGPSVAFIAIEDSVYKGDTNRAWHVYDTESFFQSEYRIHKPICSKFPVVIQETFDKFPDQLERYRQFHVFRLVGAK